MMKTPVREEYIDVSDTVKEKGEIKSIQIGGFSLVCTRLYREESGLCRLTSQKNRHVYENESASIMEFDGAIAKKIIESLDIEKKFSWSEVRDSKESTQKLFFAAGDCNIQMTRRRQFCQLYYRMGTQYFVHFQLLTDMRSLPFKSMFYRPQWGLLDPALVEFSPRPMIQYDRNPVEPWTRDPFNFPNPRGNNWRDDAVRDPTGP